MKALVYPDGVGALLADELNAERAKKALAVSGVGTGPAPVGRDVHARLFAMTGVLVTLAEAVACIEDMYMLMGTTVA